MELHNLLAGEGAAAFAGIVASLRSHLPAEHLGSVPALTLSSTTSTTVPSTVSDGFSTASISSSASSADNSPSTAGWDSSSVADMLLDANGNLIGPVAPTRNPIVAITQADDTVASTDQALPSTAGITPTTTSTTDTASTTPWMCFGKQTADSPKPKPCKCPFTNCHSCTFSDCLMCKNGKLLLHGACGNDCPVGYSAEGNGLFGRACLPA